MDEVGVSSVLKVLPDTTYPVSCEVNGPEVLAAVHVLEDADSIVGQN